MWQHSSCLGISQTEAEKEDFHFVCSDCKRKMEDAKRPKIPPLKFKLGSSSSPPSDKSTIYVNGSSQVKKRKSTESDDGTSRLPAMKKFKPYHGPSNTNGTANTIPPISAQPNEMHRAFMNGPTLSPQGQLPPIQGANGCHVPPPGLASPTRPTAHLHSNKIGQSPSSTQSHSTIASATNQTVHGSAVTTPSNGYPVYQSPHGPLSSPKEPFQPQGLQDPFHNSFNHQHPVTSHNNDVSPPFKNRPSMSPTQGNPDVGLLAFPPSAKPTFDQNGLPPYRSAAATHPSAYSGNHHLPPFSPPTLFPPSSSLSNPSANQQPPVTLSGLSPSKHSPPRPPSNGTPFLPPVAHLFPSPQVQNLHAPTKSMTPERPQAEHGHVDGK